MRVGAWGVVCLLGLNTFSATCKKKAVHTLHGFFGQNDFNVKKAMHMKAWGAVSLLGLNTSTPARKIKGMNRLHGFLSK